MTSPLLHIEDLAISFENAAGERRRAVNGVNLSLYPHQTLAVVGESGCGKSVTAMSILRLLPTPPARYDHGRILLSTGTNTIDILKLPEKDMRAIRGAQAAMIFQEPMTSLNPVYSIGDQIIETILLHQQVSHSEARDRAAQSLESVGITNPAQRLRAYPHQFSGGMRQRVMIAMALACKPRILLADEPTTALDVTIQAQILELLRDLRQRTGLGMLLITHALGVVAENADIVCVMYAGRVVEYATVTDLFDSPLHPYTRGLLRCIPTMRGSISRLVTVRDIVDNPAEFERIDGADPSLRPWWPTHTPPSGLRTTSGPASDSTLIEIRPGHWISVWRTDAALALNSPPPNLPSISSPAHATAS